MDRWQPIETAPSGGVFVVAIPKAAGRWNVAMAYRAKNGTIRSELGTADYSTGPERATHWWPLPPPPRN